MFDGAFDQVAWTFVCPVGAGEEIADYINIEAGCIIRNREFIVFEFH
jgi:hypothetical protein